MAALSKADHHQNRDVPNLAAAAPLQPQSIQENIGK
jgi:hypothetical protein